MKEFVKKKAVIVKDRLALLNPRSYVDLSVSFRSALFLESWELVTDLLKAGAEAHAGAQGE